MVELAWPLTGIAQAGTSLESDGDRSAWKGRRSGLGCDRLEGVRAGAERHTASRLMFLWTRSAPLSFPQVGSAPCASRQPIEDETKVSRQGLSTIWNSVPFLQTDDATPDAGPHPRE